jgi:sulfatase maturation enzyme AslB (radical SAM superfamily)
MYYLLPFRFERLNDKEIIVNEVGDFLITEINTVDRIVNKKISPDEELYKDLISSFFISETPIPVLIDNYAIRLRTKKSFLDGFTSLHIFVLTIRCNQNCVYCQASAKECNASQYDMKKEDLSKAIALMFKGPSPSITMEFQGGEPTLASELLLYAIQEAESKNELYRKQITYVLCTNSINLTDRVIDICREYKVLISTSLDGPEFLHNRNRGKTDSYQKVVEGIARARIALGTNQVSALMTT